MERSFQSSKNDKIAILGSGFGIYGYLKALEKIKKIKILINKSSISKIKSYKNKNELIKLNLDEIIKNSNTIIIAKRPSDQTKLIYKIIKKNKELMLYLEKPIAQNPKKSLEVLKFLKKNKINFKVNYIFYYTKWFSDISKKCKSRNNEITINWSFTNYNLNSWKFKKIFGGGIIRYYGIQTIAIISAMSFNKCLSSNLKKYSEHAYSWNAIFENSNRNKFNVNFFLNYGKNLFTIYNNNREIVNMENPFSKKKNNYKDDNRIKFLIKHIKNQRNLSIKDHTRIIQLWQKVEQKTKNV